MFPAAKSKALLDGFYDPNIGNAKHLVVRYTYRVSSVMTLEHDGCIDRLKEGI